MSKRIFYKNKEVELISARKEIKYGSTDCFFYTEVHRYTYHYYTIKLDDENIIEVEGDELIFV